MFLNMLRLCGYSRVCTLRMLGPIYRVSGQAKLVQCTAKKTWADIGIEEDGKKAVKGKGGT